MIEPVSQVVSSYIRNDPSMPGFTEVLKVQYVEQNGVQKIEVDSYTVYNRQGREEEKYLAGSRVNIEV
jgi:hypothetical protein